MDIKSGFLKYEKEGDVLRLFMKKDKPLKIEIIVEKYLNIGTGEIEKNKEFIYTRYNTQKIREKKDKTNRDRDKIAIEVLTEIRSKMHFEPDFKRITQKKALELINEELKLYGLKMSKTTFFRQNLSEYLKL